VYLDIARADRHGLYLPFNVLAQPHLRADSIASNVREAFHRAWPELATGAATFDTLFVDASLLLVHNGLSLTALRALLTNDNFRGYLLGREPDGELVASFADVYEQFKRKADQVAYAGSVLRRARQLTQLDVLRYALGQRENRLNFRSIMDSGQSVFVKLDVQNDDAKRLMGCFLTVSAEQAAKSRAEIPAHARRGQHILVIDECQLFIAQDTSTLDEILSETRKYGLHLWMANQTMSQIPERLRGGLQNIGLQAVFRVGASDAQYLSEMLAYIDPMKIKHQVVDEQTVARTHPVFEHPEEQRLLLAQEMQNFLPGQAYLSWYSPLKNGLKRAILHRPAMRLVKLKTPRVDEPEHVSSRMQEIEDYYLAEYFRRPEADTGATPSESPVYTRLFTSTGAKDTEDIDSE